MALMSFVGVADSLKIALEPAKGARVAGVPEGSKALSKSLQMGSFCKAMYSLADTQELCPGGEGKALRRL